jgi:hypothetical protein
MRRGAETIFSVVNTELTNLLGDVKGLPCPSSHVVFHLPDSFFALPGFIFLPNIVLPATRALLG